LNLGKNYLQNRRVDISFVFHAHDAQTIVYDVIAPSIEIKKELTIDIIKQESKACFRGKDKHEKKSWIIDVGQAIDKGETQKEFTVPSFNYKVYSDLSRYNPAPIQYIWPAATKPNQFHLHVHSCRWFSNKKNTTVLIKAYPDIKWELAFELKIDIKHYSHTNMPSEYRIFEKHQKIATKEGYKRWELNKKGEIPIVVGIGLKAEWDDKFRKVSLTKEWEKKTEILAKTLAKSVELIQTAINVCRGVMETTSIPVSFGVEYPKFEAVASWYQQNEPGYLKLAKVGEINFGAKPFIGVTTTIDLIAAAVTIASYSTTGSPAISKIVNKIRNAGKKVGAEISADAEFYGNIEVMFKEVKINSIKGTQGGFLLIGGKMGMKLIVEVKAGNDPWYSKKKPIIPFTALGRAEGDSYFGGEMKIDSDEKGIYIEPTLKFSGLQVKLKAEVTVGWFTESVEKEYDNVVPEKEINFAKHYLN
jgi:hypothetical protein